MQSENICIIFGGRKINTFFHSTPAVLFYVISGMRLFSSKNEEHRLIKRHSETFVPIQPVRILRPSCIPKKVTVQHTIYVKC